VSKAGQFRRYARDQLSTDLWDAKREVVRRFLTPVGAALRTGANHHYSVVADARNVIGVGVGRKFSNGKGTQDYAVRVYVRRKLPRSRLGPHVIPESIDGVHTDVIETGTFKALADSLALSRQRVRPIGPGLSVGFASGDQLVAGTVTAIVAKDGHVFVLSNNHVLAFENTLPVGTDIIQPASLDGGRDAEDRIGTLASFVALSQGDNKLDAALAQLDSAIKVTERFPGLLQLDSVQSVAAVAQSRVAKLGRGTGYTRGTIEDLGIDAQVDYESGQFSFVDQLLIKGIGTSFSDGGDSGALVVTGSGTCQPVAMLFAGSPQYSLATPIDRVLQTLGVALLQ
jgi:hypothetical protein